MTESPDKTPLSGLTRIGKAVPGVDLFAVFTFLPVPFLVLSCFFGGWWPWLAVLWVAGLMHLADRLLPRSPDAPEGAEFPAADTLSVTLAGAHFVLLVLVVAAVSGMTGLGIWARIGLFWGAGLFFGQVSNANAHELIHRADRRLFRLGMWVYISLLYGHHASAHRLVHHRLVATREDPNTAVLGESYWDWLKLAWPGEFIAGWRAEAARKQRWNPYYTYILGGIGFVWGMVLLFGLGGLAAYLGLAIYAQMQSLLSDYVQHYGLERRRTATGYEPVGPAHSWDAAAPVSSLWMLNAPRHSDHHAHPARPYPALRLGEGGHPMLPRSLPVMATIALFPRLWHRIMDPRVRWL
ncbi:alkane 1-monooxygenase [Paenirhodobacter sp.]|uniref:alkane 1-monooxygenase n=1 Tax=Paenirhodobacter sp. TaxID=1965326 RepID=UPI003B412EBB